MAVPSLQIKLFPDYLLIKFAALSQASPALAPENTVEGLVLFES
jgi:hypothetical protein